MKSKTEISEKKILSYLRRAEVVAESSPDADTKVGSILVSKKTLSVISEGYNGFIRGADDDKLPKTRPTKCSHGPSKYDYIVHAEENLICNAARNGVCMADAFVVQTISPCIRCARLLFQSGVETVYFKGWYKGSNEIEKLGDMRLKFTKFDKYTKIRIEPNK